MTREYITDHEGNPWPAARTIDGYFIEPQMWVWDYNLRLSQVTQRAPYIDHGTPWFETTGGSFDGGRMWKFHPTTGDEATDPGDTDGSGLPSTYEPMPGYDEETGYPS